MTARERERKRIKHGDAMLMVWTLEINNDIGQVGMCVFVCISVSEYVYSFQFCADATTVTLLQAE